MKAEPESNENKQESIKIDLKKPRTEINSTKKKKSPTMIVLNNNNSEGLRELETENKQLREKIKTLERQLKCYAKNEFEVEQLLDDKFEKQKHLFLVRWKYFDETYDTWEKLENLQCPKILKAYNASKESK